MEISGKFRGTSFEFEGKCPDSLMDRIYDGELYNQNDILFLEEKYINESKRFINIVDKLKKKQFNSKLKIFRDDELYFLKNFNDEIDLYSQVISENNINGFLDNNDLHISVNHFLEYEQSDKIRYTQVIYILLFLANYTDYKDNQFLFKVKLDNGEICHRIDFVQIEDISLSNIYNWVISSRENLQTRLRIIREIITNKNSFYLDDIDLETAKSLFNRIIKEQTDKYFIQVNTLKEDFLKFSEKKQASYNSLHLKFLGWISAIAIFIYGELKDYDSDKLLYKVFFSSTDKGDLFLIFFILSIVIIWIIFIKENWDNKKEYEKIKDFYVRKLFFEENDFDRYLKYPHVPLSYKIIFMILLLLLLLRLFLGYTYVK